MSAHMRGGCGQSKTGNRNEERAEEGSSRLKGVPVCLKQDGWGGWGQGGMGGGAGTLCHVTHLIYRLNGLPVAPAVDGL